MPNHTTKLWPRPCGPGTTLGLVSPSSPTDEERFARGCDWLHAEGFATRTAPSTKVRGGLHAGSPEDRARELMEFFLDPAIDGILCTRGGSGSLSILPYLDFDAIAAHPKLLVGLSDPTALLLALFARTGLVSISGQMVVQLHPEMQKDTRAHWLELLGGDWREHLGNELNWNPPWIVSDETPERHDEPNNEDRRALPGAWLHPATGVRPLVSLIPGTAEGPLLPANFSLLTRLIGTPYLPSFDGAILLLEEVDERPEGLDRMVSHLALSGLDRRLAGLVLGQFTGCTPRNQKTTEREGLGLVWDWARSLGIPVLAGFPYGHESLATAVPVGARVRIEEDPPGLRVLESPASQRRV